MKRLFIDCETGGTDPARHALLTVAAIVEIDGEEKEAIQLKMRPDDGCAVEAKALEVNGLTAEQIAGWPQPGAERRRFLNMLTKYVDPYNARDKFHLVAYNGTFDDNFLRAWFRRHGDKYYGSWFYWPPIDVAVLVADAVADQRDAFKDFKQVTVAETIGIPVDESQAHDALYDVRLCREIYRRVSVQVEQRCRVCGCTEDAACINQQTGEPCYWIEWDLCSACTLATEVATGPDSHNDKGVQ